MMTSDELRKSPASRPDHNPRPGTAVCAGLAFNLRARLIESIANAQFARSIGASTASFALSIANSQSAVRVGRQRAAAGVAARRTDAALRRIRR
jgi:hypothetical protein